MVRGSARGGRAALLPIILVGGLLGTLTSGVGASASTPVISAVGGLANVQGSGVSSLSVSPKTQGDALVLSVKVSSATATVTSVSGGGATNWSRLVSFQDNASAVIDHDLELWLGTVSTTGTSSITVNFSSSVSSNDIELAAQEFTAGLGSSTLWTKDAAAGQSNASSKTIASPPLTPTETGELYFSYSRSPGSVLAGSTSGFTYDQTADGNMVLFDPSVSSHVAPTSTQSPANTSAAVGALIEASSASTSTPTVSSLSPTSGPAAGGTTVTVTGTNFVAGATVSFGGTAATAVTVNSATSLTATSPAGSGTVNLTVPTSGGTSTTSTADQFTYLSSQTIAVTSAPQGNWVGTYGGSGYALAGWNGSSDLTHLPDATLSLVQGTRYLWADPTTDVRALESPDQSTREAGCWYAGSELELQLSFSSAYSGNLELYALDCDSTSRRETISVNAGSSPQTVALTTSFNEGAWMVFPIIVASGGSMTITVQQTGGADAVLSGIFLDPWNLVFDSEFNGSSLDTSQWSTGWFGSGITQPVNSYEQECYDPAQVSVANGELDLTAIAKAETCDGVTRPYASGIVTTDGLFSFIYGYMEARVWLPGSSEIADWPAFWANGQSFPTDGEIDVLEGRDGLACAHFHNSAGAPGTCVSGTFTGGWHTFAADWEPGSITFYYDGTEIYQDTSGITSAPMYLILNLALDGSPSNTVPATMRVDYVQVWQH